MAFTALLDMRIRPAALGEALDILRAGMTGTRSWEGCEYVHVYQQEGDPTRVLIMTRWTSDAAFSAYASWRAAQGTEDPLSQFQEGKPTMMRLTDAADI